MGHHLLEAVQRVWEMRPSQRQNTLGEAFDADEKSRLAEIPVVLPQKAKKRQFYVLRSDIEKHGVTAVSYTHLTLPTKRIV